MAGNAEESRAPLSAQLLTGQKALATGANSGIGMATAVAPGRAGADVVVNYVVGADEAEKVVEQIQGCGVNSYAHETDVSDEDQVVGMADRMVREFGSIDVMVPRRRSPAGRTLAEMSLAQTPSSC